MNFYDRITDLLFDSSLSIKDIAQDLDLEEKDIHEAIRDLGLDWVYTTKKKGHASRGQAALYEIFKVLLPGTKIYSEYPLDRGLRLDIYCKDYRLAAEYHGKQHYQYVEHFHGSKKGFYESKKRDEDKKQQCEDRGIGLVVFSYFDPLDVSTVYDSLIKKLENMPPPPEPAKTNEAYKYNRHYYEQRLKQYREYKREKYQEAKERRRQIRGK